MHQTGMDIKNLVEIDSDDDIFFSTQLSSKMSKNVIDLLTLNYLN